MRSVQLSVLNKLVMLCLYQRSSSFRDLKSFWVSGRVPEHGLDPDMAARDKANLVPRTLAPPTSNLGFALGLSQKGASHFHHLSFVVRSLPSSAASWGQNAFPSPGLHKVLQAGCHLASCSRYESSGSHLSLD